MSFKLKNYQHNIGTAACNLCFNVPEAYFLSSTIEKKKLAPLNPFLVKVVEIMQKKDFPVFCSMVCRPNFSTVLWHWFQRNIKLKVTI